MVINLLDWDRRLFWPHRDLAGDATTALTEIMLKCNAKMIARQTEEKRVKTHNDLLKLLSDPIPSGSLPQFLTAFLYIWCYNIKGFLKAGETVGYWMFFHLQVASITNTHA